MSNDIVKGEVIDLKPAIQDIMYTKAYNDGMVATLKIIYKLAQAMSKEDLLSCLEDELDAQEIMD